MIVELVRAFSAAKLTDKGYQRKMSGPKHVGTHSKSQDGLGLLWAKFTFVGEGDMAVALIFLNMNIGFRQCMGDSGLCRSQFEQRS